jgi:RNase P/RNase MRP subunit p29
VHLESGWRTSDEPFVEETPKLELETDLGVPAVVDRARELRIADDVTGGRANEEVRLADDLAFLAVEIDDGGEAPLVDGGDFLGKEAKRFPFSLAPILGRREVRHVGGGGQRFEIPGLVLLSQPSERLLERAGALLLDSVSTKVDAKAAPGGPVVVEDVRRDEANQFSASRPFPLS